MHPGTCAWERAPGETIARGCRGATIPFPATPLPTCRIYAQPSARSDSASFHILVMCEIFPPANSIA